MTESVLIDNWGRSCLSSFLLSVSPCAGAVSLGVPYSRRGVPNTNPGLHCPPVSNISGLKNAPTRPQTAYFTVRYNKSISILCVFMQVLSYANAKKKKKVHKSFKFHTFIGHF